MPVETEESPNDIILKPLPTQAAAVTSHAVIVILVGPMGSGKCVKKGTKVLMEDGSFKLAEDIQLGDQLMGDDSRPRTVLELDSGTEEMFEIIPTKGMPFTVTHNHILTLRRTRSDRKKHGKPFFDRLAGSIVQMPVHAFVRQSKTFRMTHHLYRVPVEFPYRPVQIDPYFLGLWLGDGDAHATAVTTMDQEIVEYLEKVAICYDLELVRGQQKGRACRYMLRNAGGGRVNSLMYLLHDEHLIQNKHIPHRYKCNSRDIRLQVLAGLLDTDGGKDGGAGFSITQKRKELAEDIAFLARSLGFFSSVTPVMKTIKERGFSGTYYRVGISGDCSEIPVRLPHKKAGERKQKKDVLVSCIKEIRAIGPMEYYGFVLDGNHRFLLEDFTVTHNSFGAGPLGMLVHAARNLEVLTRKNTPLYCCIIRDTHENIKHSVVPLFRDFFSEYPALQSMHAWKNDYKHLEIFTDPIISVDLFGIDDLPSVTRLQGTAYAYIMLDDVVPYTDSQRTNAGIIEDVYNAALVRCARQKAVRDGLEPKLMISSNMPDEDHWFYHRLLKPKDGPVHPETPLITKQVFYLGMDENIHLAEVSRQATKAAYMNDPVAYARFVEGKTATKYPGKRVAEYFDANWHVSKVPLEPQEGLVGFLSFDSWGHPAAVLGQQWPNGKIWVLDECQGAADIRHLIADYVKPLLMTPRWRDKVFAWRYMGDVTMNRHDQSDVNNSSKKAVEEAFKDPQTGHNAYFEEGPSQWQRIKAGFLHTLRSTAADGGPLVLIDGFACKGLVSALKGRWHYPQNNAGVVNWNLPVKDDASHVADCLANASCLLAAWDPPKQKNRKIEREKRSQSKKRAASYAA